jgi:hypothetical protein
MKKVMYLVTAMALLALIAAPNLAAQVPVPLKQEQVSTDSRYSAGTITSDIDDYLDVNYYDADIGTFLFLGGFPSDPDPNTNHFANESVIDLGGFTSGLSGGFAHSFKSFYLGAGVFSTEIFGDNKTRISALLGNQAIGGIRLDIGLGGEWTGLKWGGSFGKLRPYLGVGFIIDDPFIFAFNGGLFYDLNNILTLHGDLGVQATSGYVGFGMNGGLRGIVKPVESFTIGFSPTLRFNVGVANSNGAIDMGIGLAAGLKFTLPGKLNKISLVTGLGIDAFSVEYNKVVSTDADVTYLNWDNEVFTSTSSLGFGLVFAPDQHLNVGVGLNAFLDKLFTLDVTKMKFETGTFFQRGVGQPSDTAWFGDLFEVQLEFTVGYKF